MTSYGPEIPSSFYLWNGGIIAAIIILAVWSAIWKGFALYRAGSNHSPAWFVILMIFNTVGILEILYLFVFGKKKATVEAPVYQTPAT
ncbi:hypothetical protein GCM10027022_14940 [Alpinimonas psychrophila]|uniref:DUF5652 domain-containing protein n=1 Tax=Alpinimonas psychrophila TaxID=748908 RepID=A0A7W3PQ82_9MICO|nr:DUF5652 family protein [Alpinimonas psychrophila]MBA8830086.1 hypothetical protein [Alpinimonas psychrophila]